MLSEEPNRELLELHSAVEAFFANVAENSSRLVLFQGDAVAVRLPPDGARLAEQLLEEFGSKSPLKITVGFKNFPSAEPPGREYEIPYVTQLSIPGIQVCFEPSEIILHRGGDAGFGRVHIHNKGTSQLSGWLWGGVGWLRDTDTSSIIGSYSGLRTGVRKRLPQLPGAELTIGFVTGTASIESGPEYMVSPGNYEIVVPLEVQISGTARQTFYVEGGFATVI